MKLSKTEAIDIIKERINYKKEYYDPLDTSKYKVHYNGFEFDGYNNCHYNNLELLAKFSDLLKIRDGELRKPMFTIPQFWKGGCNLLTIEHDNIVNTEELGGSSTIEILLRIFEIEGIIEN